MSCILLLAASFSSILTPLFLNKGLPAQIRNLLQNANHSSRQSNYSIKGEMYRKCEYFKPKWCCILNVEHCFFDETILDTKASHSDGYTTTTKWFDLVCWVSSWYEDSLNISVCGGFIDLKLVFVIFLGDHLVSITSCCAISKKHWTIGRAFNSLAEGKIITCKDCSAF